MTAYTCLELPELWVLMKQRGLQLLQSECVPLTQLKCASSTDTTSQRKRCASCSESKGYAHLSGVYFMSVALLPLLRKAEDPNITVIASIAALANQR